VRGHRRLRLKGQEPSHKGREGQKVKTGPKLNRQARQEKPEQENVRLALFYFLRLKYQLDHGSAGCNSVCLGFHQLFLVAA
jgi:hypothetical protein